MIFIVLREIINFFRTLSFFFWAVLRYEFSFPLDNGKFLKKENGKEIKFLLTTVSLLAYQFSFFFD